MKGPGLRLHLDVRRLWRCPECGGERRASGIQTSVRCERCKSAPQMKLVEGQRPARHQPPPLNLLIEYDPAWDPVPEPVATDDLEETSAVELDSVSESAVLVISSLEDDAVGVSIAEEDTTDPPVLETDATGESSTGTPESEAPKRRNRRGKRRRKRNGSSGGTPSGGSPPQT